MIDHDHEGHDGDTYIHAKRTYFSLLQIADFGTSLWTQHTTRLATYTTRPQESIGMSLPWAAPEVREATGQLKKERHICREYKKKHIDTSGRTTA